MNNAPTIPPTYNERTARALINELTTNGGCTLQNDGIRARKGYAVGYGGAEALDPSRSYYDQVHRIVCQARRADASTAFGAWHDSETGLDYVEPVQIFDMEHLAMNVGRARRELAIYDLTNQVEIRLNRVNCGQCSHEFSHDERAEELTCPACGFTSEPCDFPDCR